MNRRHVLKSLAGTTVGVSIAGCSEEEIKQEAEEEAEAFQVYYFGESVTAGNVEFAVTDFLLSKEITTVDADGNEGGLTPRHQFLFVNCEAENVGDSPVELPVYDATDESDITGKHHSLSLRKRTIEDARGVYELPGGKIPQYEAERQAVVGEDGLEAGDSVSGYVVFGTTEEMKPADITDVTVEVKMQDRIWTWEGEESAHVSIEKARIE